MLEIITPQFIFKIIFVTIPFVFWIFNFIILYHLIRFGVGVQPKKFAAIYLSGSALLFSFAILFFLKVDFLTIKDQLEIIINNSPLVVH